jgi:hypothetical protein
VTVLKETGFEKRKSLFGGTAKNLDLSIQFTYSPKYGAQLRYKSEGLVPMLSELQKAFDRVMSKCSCLKSLLLGHLDKCQFSLQSSDKVILCFDKLNNVVSSSGFSKSLAKIILKNKPWSLNEQLRLDEIFGSRLLKDYIQQTVSTLRSQKHGLPSNSNPHAAIKINYASSQLTYKGFYLVINDQTLCALEADPLGIIPETNKLLQHAKPPAIKLKQVRRKNVGCLSSEEGALINALSNESVINLETIKHLNEGDLMIEEINENLKKNVKDQVDQRKKAKVWSLRQTMKNLSGESIELRLENDAKANCQNSKLINMREIGKSYAMEYFPDGFSDPITSQFSLANERQPTLCAKITDKEDTRLDAGQSKLSLIDGKYTHDEVIESGREFSDANVKDWNYDILQLDSLKEFGLVVKLFTPYLSNFEIDQKLFLNFVQVLKQKYNKNKNPFHNFKHGVAVAFSANYFLKTMPHFQESYSQAIQFAFLVASLGHDVGHTGRNNNYEINSRSKLALRYNDRSPLEQLHIAKMFSVVYKHKLNIFESFSAEVFNEIRHAIIECILATDMKVHFTLLSKFETIVSKNEAVGCKDFKELVLCILIHAADISASTRKAHIATEWFRLVSIEFRNQYNLEVEQSLPVTAYFKDLHIPLNFYKSECGFLSFIVKPLFIALRDYEFDMEETQDPKSNAQVVIPSRSRHANSQISAKNPFMSLVELIDENVKFYESKIAAINSDIAQLS